MLDRRILPALLFTTTFLATVPPAECVRLKTPSPRVIRVDFFELKPLNIDERRDRNDLVFKGELEGIITDTLERAGIRVEPVSCALQGFILDEGSYAREAQSDFILKGMFKNYNNQFVVSIRLLSNRDGVLKEVFSSPVSRVPKEIARYVLNPWFQYLSTRIASVVQSRVSRPAVLTHCFQTYNADKETQELAQYLALELPGELDSGVFGSRYQVLGFQGRSEVIQVCLSSQDLGSYLELYDFVISGDVWPGQPGQVTINIKISTGGKPKLRENLTRANHDSTRLVGEVGQFIMARWRVVTK